MSNDLFGGIMKGLGAFMPKDDPNTKLFQAQNEINDLQNKELELYAEIGKKAYPDICNNQEYSELTAELNYTRKKLAAAREELAAAQNIKTEQEKLEQESVKSRTCPNCETLNPEGVKFCQECGARLNLAVKIQCRDCGAEFPAGTRFCGECGSQL